MAKLDNSWGNNLNDAFKTELRKTGECDFESEEDVMEFIFERLNTSDFEPSYIDLGGCGEPSEMVINTAEDKKELLYEFMMNLCS